MIDLIFTYLLYGAAVGVISCLISESNIAAPIRDLIGWEVLYCPICFGVWLALPVLFLQGFLAYTGTIAFSNMWMLIILKVYRELDESTETE